MTQIKCACPSFDRYECICIRYGVVESEANDQEPCECPCHDEDEDD